MEEFNKLNPAQQEYIEKLVSASVYGDDDNEYYMMDMEELIEELREELDKLK